MTNESNDLVIWRVYEDDQGRRCQHPIGEMSLVGQEYAQGEAIMQLLNAAPNLVSALRWLVRLEGERQPDYEEQKPLAWAAARATIKDAIGKYPAQMPNIKGEGTTMKRINCDICKTIAEIDEEIIVHQMTDELRQEDDQLGAKKLMIRKVRDDLMEAAVCLKAIGERELSVELWAVIAMMVGED